MAYDNLKLEKGLYTTGKSFTQALEQIDPSENYAGTPLEGLDAYQRQLKRFDIKVSGIGSDTVSKFFQTSDSAALFPEYVSRAVRQGMEQADVLQKIVATTTVIDGMDYRAIESVENGERLTAAEVAEGASLPTTTVQVKDTLTEMHKRGRMLVASYEAVKFQKLDLFTVTLRQIGNCIAEGQLLSYRWSGDVTAGCDGLRLHFLWDGDLPEVYRVRGFAPDGACCFFGYADQQKLTVTPGQRRGFVYARSSACLLLDNEALPISLNAPNVDQMVHHYAAPFGFTAALPAGTAPGQYTVEKGTSCFGALQGFMQVLGAKGVFADPENRLCVYGSEAPVTLPGDQITSITAVTERGEAPGIYAYKIASAEPYCRRLEAGYFADKKISRRRYVNVAAYPPEQRQQVLLRKLEQAAARYRRLEVVLTGAHRLPLYAPVVPKDGVPDSAGFRIFQREITGTARQVQTRLVLCCQPKLEAMYYVAE